MDEINIAPPKSYIVWTTGWLLMALVMGGYKLMAGCATSVHEYRPGYSVRHDRPSAPEHPAESAQIMRR